ncbi:Ankyrin repeats (3 copies) [Legionella busanensis]|uniref:Ankyrin repeats (3 copies) n=1 Tax=Legionella busanensis TaxID=190655 RepID=A0A378JT15_9GAMM|nr:ankyrin repeat domain-containing protein [Legionella busanensis]STX51312.1 Ankyrin repeats (3 copies) [Legionella busanensis]
MLNIVESNNSCYQSLLNSQNISPKLILPNDFTEKVYAILHQRLQLLSSIPSENNLKINEIWQLYLLSGQLELIHKLSNNAIASLSDNWGANAAHYLAWSGNAQALKWIKRHHAQLFEINNKNGCTIAHYAAWSGNSEVLTWVKNYYPHLLELKDKIGCTIAHYAAWSGNPEALTWVKNYYPHLLEVKDKTGCTIAHYAARSGNPQALIRVKNYYPQLFEVKNSLGLTISHYAMFSNNPAQLDLALTLSNTPNTFDIDIIYLSDPTQQNKCLQTIAKMLDSNVSLTSIKFPKDIAPAIQKAIVDELTINRTIKEVTPKLEELINSSYERNNQISSLPIPTLFNIFKSVLPLSISDKKVSVLFNNMRTYLNPSHRHNYLKNKIIDLINNEIKWLSAFQLSKFLGLVEGSEDKVAALEQIREMITNNNYTSLDELKKFIIGIFASYQDILKNQSYLLSLFQTKQQTSSCHVIDACYKLLDIKPKFNSQVV